MVKDGVVVFKKGKWWSRFWFAGTKQGKEVRWERGLALRNELGCGAGYEPSGFGLCGVGLRFCGCARVDWRVDGRAEKRKNATRGTWDWGLALRVGVWVGGPTGE